MCAATLLMVRGRLDEASKLFDTILAKEPTHLYALAGKVRTALPDAQAAH